MTRDSQERFTNHPNAQPSLVVCIDPYPEEIKLQYRFAVTSGSPSTSCTKGFQSGLFNSTMEKKHFFTLGKKNVNPRRGKKQLFMDYTETKSHIKIGGQVYF